jgi:hypothetical protein
VTVTIKEVRELESKRRQHRKEEKKKERKRTKEDESVLLDDMKDFKKRVMER